MPEAMWFSRICEEFNCLPSEAIREARRLPAGMLEEIIEARHYAVAKGIVDRATPESPPPDDPLCDLAKVILAELIHEANASNE